MISNTPILITGSHRSGTTWVGKMISLSENTQYIYECFHPNGILSVKGLFDIWFTHLTVETGPYKAELNRIFNYNYSFFDAYSPVGEKGKINLRNFEERISFYRACKKIRMSHTYPIPLLKDPIALFSVPWLVKHFRFRPIILIRHPAAFVSSLIRLNWRFDFQNFLQQKTLIEKYLSSFVDEMKVGYHNEPIKEAALLWNCLHNVINEYQKTNPHWLFKRHEDLSINPITEFESIYSNLNLKFTEKIKQGIIQSTSSDNPPDVIRKTKIHQLKRDSKANVKNWKKRLSKDQISIIRKMTENVASHFYSGEDW